MTLELTDRQLQWQKACGYIDENCEKVVSYGDLKFGIPLI